MTRRAPALAAALAALTLAACGGDDTDKLDMGAVERGIERGVERDNPKTEVVAVDCPDDVEKKKGASFTCKVRGSKPGEEAEATVTQVDDEGRVRYVVP